MPEGTSALLAVLAWLQIKHYVFDFLLQTAYQMRHKGTYGHAGGLLHAGLHALGTAPVFLILPPPLGTGAAIIAVEFLVHYHTDWVKERIGRRWSLVPSQALHWYVFGADQLVHQLTYLGIAAVLAAVTG